MDRVPPRLGWLGLWVVGLPEIPIAESGVTSRTIRNVTRLRLTLEEFEYRYRVIEAAVGPRAGRGRFTYDDSGR